MSKPAEIKLLKRGKLFRARKTSGDEREPGKRREKLEQSGLETSRERYLDLFDATPVCFVILTATGGIREINISGASLLSRSGERLVGRPFVDFLEENDKGVFLKHLSRCRDSLNPTQPVSVELQLAQAPGEDLVFIELVSIPTLEKGGNGVIFKSVFRDITEFKQLQEIHRWLAAIVESSNDAIIGKDLEGKIISCNRGTMELFGYAREDLIGKRIIVLSPPELQEEEQKILERIRRGEFIQNFETVRLRKDGSRIPVSLTISPIRDDRGHVIGASNIARDITLRKEAERKLEESLAREKAANQAKDDFLAALSHELRTPLNPVLLLASDGVRNRNFQPQARMDFNTIRKNIELEARLIDDMLDLTRITRGKLALEKKPVDIHAALHDAAGTIHADVAQKRIELLLNLRAAKPIVLGDAVRLRQIFWNVLKNAVKFTPDGGKIAVETKVSSGDKLMISITDTGIGMERGELERIFGAFTQGTHHFGGLGLGLAITRALVVLQEGSIRAESAGKGKGATFSIELPLAKGLEQWEMPKAEVISKPRAPTKKIPSRGIRILLVEDHEPTRSSLTHLLLRRHFKVTPAASLSEARLLAQKGKFNLLISDIGLPDGNGCDLMEELRKRLHMKGIALTGYGMEQDVSRSHAAGFTAHLTKPVRIESLDNALNMALRGAI